MYRYGWLKSITQFSNIFGAFPVNNKIILFYNHDIHFDERVITNMEHQNIQPFIMKSGDSVNYQPNDNVPNYKLKYHKNEVKSTWILKYGTKKFLHHYMNYILVEAWYIFMVSDEKNQG